MLLEDVYWILGLMVSHGSCRYGGSHFIQGGHITLTKSLGTWSPVVVVAVMGLGLVVPRCGG